MEDLTTCIKESRFYAFSSPWDDVRRMALLSWRAK